ncbi:hypothetical protein ANCCEY_08771 [Ancylostoma ceylanicum]|uniref:ZP domain-containing protein n=1 Tax=Ancylostoma ceylanicum TaxID=53326 RepID=A0A0D6LQ30_9BILA|nr:hypothetical protein ANCCEY_08771 [Ancylostoma ceylanicum]
MMIYEFSSPDSVDATDSIDILPANILAIFKCTHENRNKKSASEAYGHFSPPMLSILLPVLLSYVTAAPERHDDHVFPADDIIELPVGRFPDPDCEYSVFRNGPFGPKVDSYGALDSSMYCLMVNNCTVSAERDSSQRVPILDEFGCSLFPNVLPHVEYPSDLNGGLLVHAFSLDVDQIGNKMPYRLGAVAPSNNRPLRPSDLDRQHFVSQSSHLKMYWVITMVAHLFADPKIGTQASQRSAAGREQSHEGLNKANCVVDLQSREHQDVSSEPRFPRRKKHVMRQEEHPYHHNPKF